MQHTKLVLGDDGSMAITMPISLNTFPAKATIISFSEDQSPKQQGVKDDTGMAGSLITDERRRCNAVIELMGADVPFTDKDDDDDEISDEANLHQDLINHFTDVFLSAGDNALLFLPIEAYGRDAFEDAHTEKTASTFPEAISAHTRRYPHATLSFKEEVDGGDTVKFRIGLRHANLLITGVCEINSLEVNFGPSCLSKYATQDINNCILFIREERAPQQTSSVQNCRQLLSQFGHQSTYYQYRANLHIFQDLKLQPTIIFTLCMLPSAGFGFSLENECR